MNGGGSYLSASDRRLLVGLGSADRAERVTVLWPSGRKQEFKGLENRDKVLEYVEETKLLVQSKNGVKVSLTPA